MKKSKFFSYLLISILLTQCSPNKDITTTKPLPKSDTPAAGDISTHSDPTSYKTDPQNKDSPKPSSPDLTGLQPQTTWGKFLKRKLQEILQDPSSVVPTKRLDDLHQSIMDAESEVIVAFVEWAGIEKLLDTPNSSNRTLLSVAIGRKDPAMVEALLRKGADPNLAPTSTNHKPLYGATLSPDKDVAQILLDYGANINEMATSDMTVLEAARKRKQLSSLFNLNEAEKASLQEIIELLERKGAKTYTELQQATAS